MRHHPVLSPRLCSTECLSSNVLSIVFTVLIALLSLSISSQVNAIVANPIATQCTSNQIRDELSDADYFNLLPNNRSNTASNPNAVTIGGKESKPVPLKIKMTKTESGTNASAIVNESFSSFSKNGNRGIFVHQTFNNKVGEAQANITLEFIDSRDPTGNTPLYLDKVGVSAFDIDDGNEFDDYVIVTGLDKNNNPVLATFQTIVSTPPSEIGYGNFNSTGSGLYSKDSNNCAEQSLDVKCQGAVSFNTPVKSITIIYTNRKGRITTNQTSRQGMEFRLDNYCYAPPRVFSGIVFNDNGGANDNDNANGREADLNSSNPIYSNANYFDGEFDGPAERGITGSTVDLVDCANPNTTYATKALTAADNGVYTFRVEQDALGTQTNLCLIETGNTASSSYSVRTTTDKITIPIIANTFFYPNNNFGRVIAANAALVLEKEQFAHDCDLTSLTDASIAYTQDPISGNDIEPGECIAYKIIATNRAHIAIGSIVIKDKLQEQGVGGANITSRLATPTRTSAPLSVGYTDGMNIGDNDEIITADFDLAQRSKQTFYFNTQYGSTQTN